MKMHDRKQWLYLEASALHSELVILPDLGQFFLSTELVGERSRCFLFILIKQTKGDISLLAGKFLLLRSLAGIMDY